MALRRLCIKDLMLPVVCPLSVVYVGEVLRQGAIDVDTPFLLSHPKAPARLGHLRTDQEQNVRAVLYNAQGFVEGT